MDIAKFNNFDFINQGFYVIIITKLICKEKWYNKILKKHHEEFHEKNDC